MVAAVSTRDMFRAEKPRALVTGPYFFDASRRQYDVAPGDRRFVVLRERPTDVSTRLELILNWFDELNRLAP
jgi:hypothetical protein